ncbi:pyrimidine-specific ribonucleoside hydrolase RihA [Serratia odorifera]|uniref:Inosine-uridine preferring nucleoside hydrolase n=1 Tax=Serratia odorifera DSM 4582 TaxID=667129 RepID=D4E9Q8_SEROD|nr:pyrimidine-specific ribonucleoside hydrolase RihA [Serratia odorifera]EFE93475.1 Inosine-uridine preferring nucleoside hydrolase [Serratia odorifera DSM 4582]PNK88403.1 pyrimidine-specific ribonucleoside hydrolase RihA [Serratia odorifera]RII69354.1 pyrimidine-specific ribonucleoside hydrolase RihA [Serratia odorifera]
MPRPIIIDCDPGLDDAIALAMALRAPDLDVKAITTSAGNQTPDKTLHNALALLTLMQREDIPVAGAAAKPLLRPLVIAEQVHGKTGMGNTRLPTPRIQPAAASAVTLIADLLRASPRPITLVVTGPMTNIALLLAQYPQLKANIERIVFMGGALHGGNATPVAEFNIYVDPEAAEMVLQSGVPLTMAGLNVTHQALMLPQDVERVKAIDNPVAKAVGEMLDFYLPVYLRHARGLPGAAMHDPCAIAWLLAPQLFDSRECWVGVETQGTYTLGQTVVDEFQQSGNAANVQLLTGIDRQGFVELLLSCLRRY